MEAFAGIDVAFAKGKYLPISVCVWRKSKLIPLPLRSKQTPIPPRGHGNAKILDTQVVSEFVESTARYLRKVERVFNVTIRRIAIDAPSEPKTPGADRREAEKALDRRGISCITTPDARQFEAIRTKVQTHLSAGGEESKLPHANQLWMIVGFELFKRLRQEWECLEVFPHATAVVLNSAKIHKSRSNGLISQLSAVALFTGWPEIAWKAKLIKIAYGCFHDRLDAYLSAWVASLSSDQRDPIGIPPNDVIWVPRIKTVPRHGV